MTVFDIELYMGLKV